MRGKGLTSKVQHQANPLKMPRSGTKQAVPDTKQAVPGNGATQGGRHRDHAITERSNQEVTRTDRQLGRWTHPTHEQHGSHPENPAQMSYLKRPKPKREGLKRPSAVNKKPWENSPNGARSLSLLEHEFTTAPAAWQHPNRTVCPTKGGGQ